MKLLHRYCIHIILIVEYSRILSMLKEHWLKHKRVATVAPVIVIIINPLRLHPHHGGWIMTKFLILDDTGIVLDLVFLPLSALIKLK